MLEYRVNGFISVKNGIPVICEKKGVISDSINLIEDIKDFILKNPDIGNFEEVPGYESKTSKDFSLRGEISTIPNCSLMIWVSEKEENFGENNDSENILMFHGEYCSYTNFSSLENKEYELSELSLRTKSEKYNLEKVFKKLEDSYCKIILETHKPIRRLTCYNVLEIVKEVKLPSGDRVNLSDLMKVVYDLANLDSVVINNISIQNYLHNKIWNRGTSENSFSAYDKDEMWELYDDLESLAQEN